MNKRLRIALRKLDSEIGALQAEIRRRATRRLAPLSGPTEDEVAIISMRKPSWLGRLKAACLRILAAILAMAD